MISGMNEKELDIANQIADLLLEKEKLQQENKQLKSILTELEEWLQSIIYEIEPMGCSINYNCEYDSEEDYINAMKEQSKLNTLKIIKDKIQELKEKYK